eukprot:COSAG06_NODE_3130_length_5807_cov_14.069727_7_plen_202_part_00
MCLVFATADAPTNHAPTNLIRQASYLQSCVSALEAGGDAAAGVIAELEACRAMITDPRCQKRPLVCTSLQLLTTFDLPRQARDKRRKEVEKKRCIFRRRTTRWHVATDILKLDAPHAALAAVLPPPPTEAQIAARGGEAAAAAATAASFEQLRASAYACKSPTYKPARKVLGLSTAENSMLRQSAPGAKRKRKRLCLLFFR